MFLLRARRPERFGKWIERLLAPDPDHQTSEFDPAIRLDGGLEGIEWLGDRDPDDFDPDGGELGDGDSDGDGDDGPPSDAARAR